jgi:hypothetical protein
VVGAQRKPSALPLGHLIRASVTGGDRALRRPPGE